MLVVRPCPYRDDSGIAARPELSAGRKPDRWYKWPFSSIIVPGCETIPNFKYHRWCKGAIPANFCFYLANGVSHVQPFCRLAFSRAVPIRSDMTSPSPAPAKSPEAAKSPLSVEFTAIRPPGSGTKPPAAGLSSPGPAPQPDRSRSAIGLDHSCGQTAGFFQPVQKGRQPGAVPRQIRSGFGQQREGRGGTRASTEHVPNLENLADHR